jgi:hypothetical protein
VGGNTVPGRTLPRICTDSLLLLEALETSGALLGGVASWSWDGVTGRPAREGQGEIQDVSRNSRDSVHG